MGENGSDPALAFEHYVSQAQDAVAAQVASFRSMLEAEVVLQRRLHEQLRGSNERRKRLERVVEILDGQDQHTKPKKRRPVGNDWSITDQKIEEIWLIMRSQSEPFTCTSLVRTTKGLSSEATRRAAAVLRERELLRLVGSTKGGGKLLFPMPGTENMNSRGEVEGAVHAA